MLTVFVAVAILLAVGLALGRAALFRVLVSVLALLEDRRSRQGLPRPGPGGDVGLRVTVFYGKG